MCVQIIHDLVIDNFSILENNRYYSFKFQSNECPQLFQMKLSILAAPENHLEQPTCKINQFNFNTKKYRVSLKSAIENGDHTNRVMTDVLVNKELSNDSLRTFAYIPVGSSSIFTKRTSGGTTTWNNQNRHNFPVIHIPTGREKISTKPHETETRTVLRFSERTNKCNNVDDWKEARRERFSHPDVRGKHIFVNNDSISLPNIQSVSHKTTSVASGEMKGRKPDLKQPKIERKLNNRLKQIIHSSTRSLQSVGALSNNLVAWKYGARERVHRNARVGGIQAQHLSCNHVNMKFAPVRHTSRLHTTMGNTHDDWNSLAISHLDHQYGCPMDKLYTVYVYNTSYKYQAAPLANACNNPVPPSCVCGAVEHCEEYESPPPVPPCSRDNTWEWRL